MVQDHGQLCDATHHSLAYQYSQCMRIVWIYAVHTQRGVYRKLEQVSRTGFPYAKIRQTGHSYDSCKHVLLVVSRVGEVVRHIEAASIRLKYDPPLALAQNREYVFCIESTRDPVFGASDAPSDDSPQTRITSKGSLTGMDPLDSTE